MVWEILLVAVVAIPASMALGQWLEQREAPRPSKPSHSPARSYEPEEPSFASSVLSSGPPKERSTPEVTPMPATARLYVSNQDQLCMWGKKPRHVPSTWLGNDHPSGLYGLSPYSMHEVKEALEKDRVPLEVTREAENRMKRASIISDATQRVHRGEVSLPNVKLAGDHKLDKHQRVVLAFADATQGRFLLADDMGLGKAQPYDAKILTPSGWRLMGELRAGDSVIGRDGYPTQVEAVFDQGEREVYRVTFSDGASTETCEEHLWTVQTPNDRVRTGKWRTMELREIVNAGLHDKSKNRKWFVPMARPIQFPRAALPLDPYLLGALLGDGSISRPAPAFTNEEERIVLAVAERLPEGVTLVPAKEISYRLSGSGAGKRNPLGVILKTLGVNHLSDRKFIPPMYLTSAVSQRLALLCGLMDTDGYAAKDGTLQYTTVSARLSRDVLELVRSLGGTARVTRKHPTFTYKGEKRMGSVAYTLTIALPDEIIPFRYSRKMDRWNPRSKYPVSRSIEQVERVGIKQTRCIRVAAFDHLYVTDDYLVTHNTLSALAVGKHLDCERVVIVTKATVKPKWRWEIRKFFGDHRVMILEGNESRPIPSDVQYVILNYDIAPAWLPEILAWKPELAVADELHKIANPKAKTSAAVKQLLIASPFAIGLSGTPMRNRPRDLWNILDAIQPGWWGRQYDFERAFCMGRKRSVMRFIKGKKKSILVWSADGVSHEDVFHERMKSAMLRREKSEIDLPPRSRAIIPVALTAKAHEAYVSFQGQLAKAFATHNYSNVLNLLTSLWHTSSLGRVDATVDKALEIVKVNERPVVVFAYFRDSLDAIQAGLEAGKVRVGRIDGSTSQKQREEVQRAFQTGELDVFLGQVQAAGEGIDLYRADTTLHHDITWTPFEADQAESRVHRKGQTNPTLHLYFLGEGTIDEKMLDVTIKKLQMSKSILDTGEKIDADVIRALKEEHFGAKVAV